MHTAATLAARARQWKTPRRNSRHTWLTAMATTETIV